MDQTGQAAQGGAQCKKCLNCNQLVVIQNPEQGLLTNNQVIKMIKHYQDPFLRGSVEAANSQQLLNIVAQEDPQMVAMRNSQHGSGFPYA